MVNSLSRALAHIEFCLVKHIECFAHIERGFAVHIDYGKSFLLETFSATCTNGANIIEKATPFLCGAQPPDAPLPIGCGCPALNICEANTSYAKRTSLAKRHHFCVAKTSLSAPRGFADPRNTRVEKRGEFALVN